MFRLTLIFSLLLLSSAQYHAGNIRLVGGSYPWEGRVEIYLSGTWGTITGFHWSSSDAQTVCYTLGYFKPGKSNGTLFSLEIIITNHSGAIPRADAYFGEGSGAIHLDYVRCPGNEYNLTDCEIASNTRQTNHAQDVGVSCQPAPESFQDGNVRLVGGSTNWEGRVEMYIMGDWATIDDSSWTAADAQVVCRQLDHSTHGTLVHSCCSYGQGNSSIHIDWVFCQGSEPNITSCLYSSSENGTDNFTDVGVQCQPGSLYTEGDIRLVGGSYSWEGRVEIYLSGTWGTVGHDYADSHDAQVVCRQLGYDTQYGVVDISQSWAYFGLGSGPIHLNHLQCTGREHSLINCRHDNI